MGNKEERNKEIYAAKLSGVKMQELSEKYGISVRRIRNICKVQEEKIEKESDLLYMAIRMMTTDVRLAGVVYGTLKRNGIHTIDETKALTDEQMKKFRNCGTKMMELINNFKAATGSK